MSNSIWKTPDQKPDEYETILFWSYEYGEPEQGHYQGGLFVPHSDEFESLESDDVEKWCYLDDLIAAADRAERLQKAVENYEKVVVGAMFAPDVGDITAGLLKESHETIKQLIKEQ